jgi:two-component sensor histidine kinase
MDSISVLWWASRCLKSSATIAAPDRPVGFPTAQQLKMGLGAGLIEEFVRQAGGTLSLESSSGTIARLALPANAASPHPSEGIRDLA